MIWFFIFPISSSYLKIKFDPFEKGIWYYIRLTRKRSKRKEKIKDCGRRKIIPKFGVIQNTSTWCLELRMRQWWNLPPLALSLTFWVHVPCQQPWWKHAAPSHRHEWHLNSALLTSHTGFNNFDSRVCLRSARQKMSYQHIHHSPQGHLPFFFLQFFGISFIDFLLILVCIFRGWRTFSISSATTGVSLWRTAASAATAIPTWAWVPGLLYWRLQPASTAHLWTHPPLPLWGWFPGAVLVILQRMVSPPLSPPPSLSPT